MKRRTHASHSHAHVRQRRRLERPVARAASRVPRWPFALALVFGLAVAWRWAYLARLAHTPLADSLDADARIYWSWSDAIVRHGLVPPSPFFLAPLYPYVLALWRALSGGGIGEVLAIQAVGGGLAVVLLMDAASRLAGRPAALVVGIALALFQTGTFFDGLILPESLLWLIESALVWLVVRTDWARAGPARFALYGLAIGILAQGRATHAALLLLAVPLAGSASASLRQRMRAVGIVATVFALCCAPSLIANRQASGEWIPFTYNLGFNLEVGNNPDANGAYVDIVQGSQPVPLPGTSPITGGALDGRAFILATEGLRLSPAASSAYWAQRAMTFVRSHPLTASRLMGLKLLLAWNARETPQIENPDSFAHAAGPLGAPLVGTFAFVGIAGLFGAWGARGVRERWLIGYVLITSLTLLPFFVTDRYRDHLVPALAVLAAIGLERLMRLARNGTTIARVRSGVVLAVAAAIVFAPLKVRGTESRDWGIAADQAIRFQQRGDYANAVREFARVERALAGKLDTLSPSARTDLAAFHFRYGIALEALGRDDEAIAHWERAAALAPEDAASLGRLSIAYERAGRSAEATRMRHRLVEVPGGRGQLLVNDGWAAAHRGDLVGAERQFLEAVQETPDLAVAWEGLIRVRIQTRRFAEASNALDQARGAGLDPVSAAIYESYLSLEQGERSSARRVYQQIPSDFTSNDPVLQGLIENVRHRIPESSTSR